VANYLTIEDYSFLQNLPILNFGNGGAKFYTRVEVEIADCIDSKLVHKILMCMRCISGVIMLINDNMTV